MTRHPCDGCKRFPNCPQPCFPKIDYMRHVKRKRKKRARMEEHGSDRGRCNSAPGNC